MRTFSRLLVLFLGLTTATSVFYAYQQNRALRTARLAAESLERERADLRDRLQRAEQARPARVRSGEGEFPGEAGPAAGPAAADAAATVAAINPEAGFRGGFPALLDNPEAQRLMAIQQRGALDQRYGSLFRLLNLPPAQLERLKDLLIEKQTAAMDVLAAARAQGLNNRENRGEIRSLLEATQDEIDANIRMLLGDANFQRYENFNQTQTQRAVVSRLEQRLGYSALPLSPQQSEQLVQLLAAHSPTPGGERRAVDLRNGAVAAFIGGGGAPITDDFVNQAATLLNPTQLEALRQLQAEQKAQADLGQMLRETRGRRTAPTAPSTTPPRG